MAVSRSISGSILARFSDLDIHSVSAMVLSARKGLNPAVFYNFADAIKMSKKSLAALLSLSSCTINNYKAKKKLLEPVQSEHLLKLITLFGKGEEIFGNIDEFNYWLKKPNWNAKENPIECLVTPGGVDLVSDELDRLAYGYAV